MTSGLKGLIDLANNAQEFEATYSMRHQHAPTRHPNSGNHADKVAALIRFNPECLKRQLRCECGYS